MNGQKIENDPPLFNGKPKIQISHIAQAPEIDFQKHLTSSTCTQSKPRWNDCEAINLSWEMTHFASVCV